MKDQIKTFQQGLELKLQRKLTEHQIDVMYRCFLLNLDEEETELALLADTPQKEEYIIASILDRIDKEYIKKEILSEARIEKIQTKRLDFLLEKIKSTDPQYLALQNEVDQLNAYNAMAEEQSELLLKRIKLATKEMADLQNVKQKLMLEIDSLKTEIRKKEKALKDYSANSIRPTEAKIIDSHKKPRSPFGEKVRFLFFGEMKDNAEENVNAGDMVELLCNPDFSLEQLQELEQGFQDGLPYKELRKIAKPELSVEIIREMRYFICRRLGFHISDLQNGNQQDLPESKLNDPSHEEIQQEEPLLQDEENFICEENLDYESSDEIK